MLFKQLLILLYLTMSCYLNSHLFTTFLLYLFFVCWDRGNSVVALDQAIAPSGLPFYKKCESLIKAELSKLEVNELEHEVKLTRFANFSDPVSFFYPENKISPENKLFSWKTTNLSLVENVIVIGVNEKSSPNNFAPFGWMAGTFVALRLVNSSATLRDPSNELKENYYAMVAYVRKDLHKDLELEWDRWSFKAVKNLMRRETLVEAAAAFTVETFLCSYGSCSCAACKCEQGRKGAQNKINNAGTTDAKMPALKPKGKAGKQQKKRKNLGLATAIANSQMGQAHATSIGKGKFNSRSGAISNQSSAVAESHAYQGKSAAYSSGSTVAISESSSRTGDTRSVSKTKKGYAQSSSQSFGGGIEAVAIQSMETDTEYNYYDDEEAQAGGDIDPKSLIRDTNNAFSEAFQRAEKYKAATKQKGFTGDICLQEYETEVNLTLTEWKSLLTKGGAEDQSKENLKQPLFLYQNPLRYGIDAEVGVNTSVLITSVIPGYFAPRQSCCDLTINPSSTIGDFLRMFRQDCNSDLETQVARLEKSFTDTNVAKIMQTKKLALNQLRDLIPMVLLKVYENQTMHQLIPSIRDWFDNSTSEEINLATVLIVQATRYIADVGHLHKVKIIKGLTLNVRTMLTGIMLETKRCMEEKKCDEAFLNRLNNEKRMILGLYLFLRSADSRLSYFPDKSPTELFLDFLKLHDNAIDTLAHCKSRRVIIKGHKINRT